MKETKVLGALLPSHPDLIPIIQELREKYQLAVISPERDPIEEIYYEDKIIPLEDFRKEIFDLVVEKVDFFAPESKFRNLYKQAKINLGKPLQFKGFARVFPKEIKNLFKSLYDYLQHIFKLVVEIVDKQNQEIADIIYIHLLTGETQEAPADWLSKVGVMKIDEEPVIFVMASQFADPEHIVWQFRELYSKTFGKHRPKVTDTVVSTAYFLAMKRLKQPWEFIVEEYIRLNKFRLPRDFSSGRYLAVRQKYAQRLKKRMQRTEKVLAVIGRDIKQP